MATTDARARLAQWRELQAGVGRCHECIAISDGTAAQPLQPGEIPDPPPEIDILFVGVAPRRINGGDGSHFYSSAADKLRLGLFTVLDGPPFGLSPMAANRIGREEGDRAFHAARLFFVHVAKVRPINRLAPRPAVLRACAREHLRAEIPLLAPRAVCFLGTNASRTAARAFGAKVGATPVRAAINGWTGEVVAAPQPRTPWLIREAAEIIRGIWRTAPAATETDNPATDGPMGEGHTMQPTQPPLERFLQASLKEFEQHLRGEGLKEGPIDHRMRGAREFARFLLGRPHTKGEQTKGTI